MTNTPTLRKRFLATWSLVLHRILKAVLGFLLNLRARAQRRNGLGRSWSTLGEGFVNKAHVPALSILAPRWNTHAVLASLGPIELREQIVIGTSSLRGAAKSWSIVLYDGKGQTLAWTGSSLDQTNDLKWTVPAGSYGLGLRLYSPTENLLLPNVHADGADLRCARDVRGEAERYAGHLESIRNKDGWFFRALHYYVFHHLQYSRNQRAAWVQRQFLPVGNPDTEWYYGYLEPGEQLSATYPAAQDASILTYISFYNRSSFPVAWGEISGGLWQSEAFDQPVAYAIRRVMTGAAPERSAGDFAVQSTNARA